MSKMDKGSGPQTKADDKVGKGYSEAGIPKVKNVDLNEGTAVEKRPSGKTGPVEQT